jgi:hypothetical protein
MRIRHSLTVAGITCSLLLTPFLLHAQVEVFRTVEDLVNGTAVTYPEHEFHKRKGKKPVTLIFRHKATKEELTIDCASVWGFAYKGQLFRVMRPGKYLPDGMSHIPVILSKHNGAFYWLNGQFLQALTQGRQSAELNGSYTGFISSTVDGDAMVVTGLSKGPGWVKKNGDQFFKDHPELGWLEDCSKRQIKKGYLHSIMEGCIDFHEEPSE